MTLITATRDLGHSHTRVLREALGERLAEENARWSTLSIRDAVNWNCCPWRNVQVALQAVETTAAPLVFRSWTTEHSGAVLGNREGG